MRVNRVIKLLIVLIVPTLCLSTFISKKMARESSKRAIAHISKKLKNNRWLVEIASNLIKKTAKKTSAHIFDIITGEKEVKNKPLRRFIKKIRSNKKVKKLIASAVGQISTIMLNHGDTIQRISELVKKGAKDASKHVNDVLTGKKEFELKHPREIIKDLRSNETVKKIGLLLIGQIPKIMENQSDRFSDYAKKTAKRASKHISKHLTDVLLGKKKFRLRHPREAINKFGLILGMKTNLLKSPKKVKQRTVSVANGKNRFGNTIPTKFNNANQLSWQNYGNYDDFEQNGCNNHIRHRYSACDY